MRIFRNRIMLLSTFVIGFILQAKAQNDFIVTSTQDTIHGKVKDSWTLSSNAKFKAQGSNAYQRIDPAEVKGFTVDKGSKGRQQFAAKTLAEDKKQTFVEVIEQGPIQLYQSRKVINNHYKTKEIEYTWWIGKNDQAVFALATAGKDQALTGRTSPVEALFSDNPQLLEELKASPNLGIETLKTFIKRYNQAL